jgi:hypothetical protein
MLPAALIAHAPQPLWPGLWVGHWPKPLAAAAVAPPARGLVIDTCQRVVVAAMEPAVTRGAPELYRGIEAYRFLLELGTGLLSAVPGETNVFGQFKRAWERCRQEADADVVAALGPVIAAVVGDTRRVRHAHLQHIGGASYGGLARRLLELRAGEQLLIVGAGEFARSLLPFFRAQSLAVWNRHQPGPSFAAAARLFAPGEAALAARWASCVVMTTPADAGHDACWQRWLLDSQARAVLHLGRRRHEPLAWPAGIRSFDLDDVFALRRAQDDIRSLQLARARQAVTALAAARAVAMAAPAIAAAPRRAAG